MARADWQISCADVVRGISADGEKILLALQRCIALCLLPEFHRFNRIRIKCDHREMFLP